MHVVKYNLLTERLDEDSKFSLNCSRLQVEQPLILKNSYIVTGSLNLYHLTQIQIISTFPALNDKSIVLVPFHVKLE